MSPDPEKHHRRSIRLKGYDYSQAGAYYITVCIHQRRCLLGEISSGEMNLSDLGHIAAATWDNLPAHYDRVILDAFVVMPNHIHGILVLTDEGTKRTTLSEVIRGYKSFSARAINAVLDQRGQPVWQRSYYERIIRNEREYDAIREYIGLNPARWTDDHLHPAAAV